MRKYSWYITKIWNDHFTRLFMEYKFCKTYKLHICIAHMLKRHILTLSFGIEFMLAFFVLSYFSLIFQQWICIFLKKKLVVSFKLKKHSLSWFRMHLMSPGPIFHLSFPRVPSQSGSSSPPLWELEGGCWLMSRRKEPVSVFIMRNKYIQVLKERTYSDLTDGAKS